MGDLTLFFAAVFGWFTNALGVNDRTRAAIKAAVAAGNDTVDRLRIWVRTKMTRPLTTLMFLVCGILLALLGVASLIHVYLIPSGTDGVFGKMWLVSGIPVGLTLLAASFQRFWCGSRDPYQMDDDGNVVEEVIRVDVEGNLRTDADHQATPDLTADEMRIPLPNPRHRPRSVRFLLSIGLTVITAAATAVMIAWHAMLVENRGLWALSMAASWVMVATIAGSAAFLSWLIRKGVSTLETILQVVTEPLAALLPGVTLANVRERLFAGGRLNILEEDRIGQTVVAAATLIAIALNFMAIPVYIVGPSVNTVYLAYGAGFSVIVARWLAFRYASSRSAAETRTAHAADFLHKHAMTATVVLMGLPLLISALGFGPAFDKATSGLKYALLQLFTGFGDVVNGSQGVAGGWSWWSALLALLFGGLPAVGIVVWLTGEWTSRWKHVARFASVLLPAYFFLAMMSDFNGYGERGILLVDPPPDASAASVSNMQTLSRPVQTRHSDPPDGTPPTVRAQAHAPAAATPDRPKPKPTAVAKQSSAREKSLGNLQKELEDF